MFSCIILLICLLHSITASISNDAESVRIPRVYGSQETISSMESLSSEEPPAAEDIDHGKSYAQIFERRKKKPYVPPSQQTTEWKKFQSWQFSPSDTSQTPQEEKKHGLCQNDAKSSSLNPGKQAGPSRPTRWMKAKKAHVIQKLKEISKAWTKK